MVYISNFPDMRKDMPLNRRQETFCRLYAENPNGAAAAREAGYKSAANQASRLLKNPDVVARLAELAGPAAQHQAAVAADRDAAARALSEKLNPIYEASLRERDYDGVMQVIELQGRIEQHLTGGSTIKARGPRPPVEPAKPDEAANDNALKDLDDRMYDVEATLQAIRRMLERIEQFVDPADEHNLLRRYRRDGREDEHWFTRADYEVERDGYLDESTLDAG
jgi:hypothetical protein